MIFSGYHEDEFSRAVNALMVHATSSKTGAISNFSPHYTNDAFRNPRTVYLDPEFKLDKDERYPTVVHPNVGYNYSDRIWQNDWDKARASNEALREKYGHKDTAERWEAWLRLCFDKPNLRLVHIMASFNQSTGYAYQVFGYLPEGE